MRAFALERFQQQLRDDSLTLRERIRDLGPIHVENGKLYAQLNSLRESDRKKAGELHRLSNVDTLTGVANRRAFDEALDQEWRRMLRHNNALSLMIAPLASRGVWQLPHARMVLTR